MSVGCKMGEQVEPKLMPESVMMGRITVNSFLVWRRGFEYSRQTEWGRSGKESLPFRNPGSRSRPLLEINPRGRIRTAAGVQTSDERRTPGMVLRNPQRRLLLRRVGLGRFHLGWEFLNPQQYGFGDQFGPVFKTRIRYRQHILGIFREVDEPFFRGDFRQRSHQNTAELGQVLFDTRVFGGGFCGLRRCNLFWSGIGGRG